MFFLGAFNVSWLLGSKVGGRARVGDENGEATLGFSLGLNEEGVGGAVEGDRPHKHFHLVSALPVADA